MTLDSKTESIIKSPFNCLYDYISDKVSDKGTIYCMLDDIIDRRKYLQENDTIKLDKVYHVRDSLERVIIEKIEPIEGVKCIRFVDPFSPFHFTVNYGNGYKMTIDYTNITDYGDRSNICIYPCYYPENNGFFSKLSTNYLDEEIDKLHELQESDSESICEMVVEI